MTEVEDLAPGLHLAPLPLPFPGLTFVNCYVFLDDEEVTLVDVGVDDDAGYGALVASLRSLKRHPGQIRRIVVTHLHPDHVGLVARLVVQTGAEFVMHAEASQRLAEYNDWEWFRRVVRETALANGGPPDQVASMTADEPRPPWAAPAPSPDTLVGDGDEIPVGSGRTLQAIHTPGHEPSHLCLVDSLTGALLSGDHVLPRITPFVPYLGPETDNLGTYLSSLRRVEELEPPVTYPAHGEAIAHGAERARQIRLHHERRLRGMLELTERSATAWQVMEQTFRPNLSAMHMRLAFQETMAHLEHLRTKGLTVRDDSGRYRPA